MLIKRCKSVTNVELTLEKDDEQVILTAFLNVLNKVVRVEGKTNDKLEDILLELEDVDITYNKKTVITNIVDH